MVWCVESSKRIIREPSMGPGFEGRPKVMKRARLSTQLLMAQIAVVAIVLSLLVPFFRVVGDRHHHRHARTATIGPDHLPCYAVPSVRTPFWPRYWRSLAGRPWRGRSFCRTDDRSSEACELAHP